MTCCFIQLKRLYAFLVLTVHFLPLVDKEELAADVQRQALLASEAEAGSEEAKEAKEAKKAKEAKEAKKAKEAKEARRKCI